MLAFTDSVVLDHTPQFSEDDETITGFVEDVVATTGTVGTVPVDLEGVEGVEGTVLVNGADQLPHPPVSLFEPAVPPVAWD